MLSLGMTDHDIAPRLLNLTPHAITLVVGGTATTISPEANAARAELRSTRVDTIRVGAIDVPVTRTEIVPGSAQLPPTRLDTLLIVSRIVADANPGRRDLLVPHDIVRIAGKPVGCASLALVN